MLLHILIGSGDILLSEKSHFKAGAHDVPACSMLLGTLTGLHEDDILRERNLKKKNLSSYKLTKALP